MTTNATPTAPAASSAATTKTKTTTIADEGLFTGSFSIPWTAVMVFVVSFRMICANMAPIMDCDEVFNYWEPVHFMQFNTGMQTWEYASQHALRTYAYLVPISFTSHLLYSIPKLMQMPISKSLLFQLLRSTNAAFTGYTEVEFIHALSIYYHSDTKINDILTARIPANTPAPAINALEKPSSLKSLLPFWTLVTNLLAAGMFHASPALLPSVTVMQLFMLSYSYYLKGSEKIAVTLGLVAVLGTGWPFCALLWIPMGMKILLDAFLSNGGVPGGAIQVHMDDVFNIIGRTAKHAILIQLIVSLIDYYFYGDFVFPTFNILKYNAASGGDELYGVEDLLFYVKNLIVNWNGVVLLASLALLPNICWDQQKNRILLVPLVLWFAAMCPRAHKEERFLFPVYPLLGFACALTLDTIIPLFVPFLVTPKKIERGSDIPNIHVWIQGWSSKFGIVIILFMGSISVLRSMALSHYYTAPMSVYQHLHDRLSSMADKENDVAVCVGGEWHRFPSSFHLPHSTTKLEYLTSKFKGQLPAPFHLKEHGAPTPFNDLNLEEPSRYIDGGISSCTYVVDLVLEEREEKPECIQHMKNDEKGEKVWKEIYSVPFLDSERTGLIDRVLYLPWRKDDSRIYAKYALFHRTE